ncbi:MAG TPA: glycosyltransferase family 39 protein [Candidatus Saccharimonadales bacterium]|nr:glycosyltransferase family 39 protein [Candidatus Saccharimonadales bacterium]
MLNQFNVSIWGDEAFSAILSQKSFFDIIKIISRDTSPPLYNLLEHIWFQVFGSSEVSIRALSFLFFMVAIFFVFKIGEYYWDKKTGFLAAVLTFLNPFFFIYAFEGRMYSLLAATIIGSFYFFIKKEWKLYIVITALALYTHHFAMFALFFQGLWFFKKLIFDRDKKIKENFYAFIITGVLYIPWLIPLYNQTKMVGSGFWLAKPTLADLSGLVSKYLAKGSDNFFTKSALYVVIATFVVRIWNKNTQKTIFLLLWFFVPILTVFAISQKFQPIFYDRYMIYTIPAAMLILVSQKRQISSILIAVIIALFLISDANYFTHPTKLPFRNLASYVMSVEKNGDYLINWNGASHHLWESKYYKIPAPIYVPGNVSLPYFVGTALMEPGDIISKIPKNTRRVGVITSGPVEEVKIPGYTEKEVRSFGDLKFIWYE